jgi:quercetin dioxygenase-like cupin family protein
MIMTQPNRTAAKPPAHPEYFEGNVVMQPLFGTDTTEVEVIAVFFTDGARTIPHTHSTDQILQVLSGRCVVADETGRREYGIGELIHIAAGRWHWHGAAPGFTASHLSVRRPGPSDWSIDRRDW